MNESLKRLRRKLALLLAPELAGELAEAERVVRELSLQVQCLAAGENIRGGYRRVDLNGLLRFAYMDQEEQARLASRRRYQSWREGLMRLVSLARESGGRS